MTDKVMMVVVAGPDCPDIGVAGTMAKFIKMGGAVVEVLLSYGELASEVQSAKQLAEQRRREQEEAARCLGIDRVVFFDWGDAHTFSSHERTLELAELMRREKPDIVLTHWPKAKHPGLRTTSQLTQDAAFWAGLPGWKSSNPCHSLDALYFFGMDAWDDSFEAEGFVNTTDEITLKRKALRCHKSMWDLISRDPEVWMSIWIARDRIYGHSCGVMYAEGFRRYWMPRSGPRALNMLSL